MRRRLSAIIAALLATAIPAGAAPAAKRALAPLSAPRTAVPAFENAPFPYRGEVPDKSIPFLDVVDGDRRGHTSPRGGVYWEDQTYNDRRALLYLPRGFDPRRPALIVVFFHGNEATLIRDVQRRQQVPRQLGESGLNAALVAPQFAVNALDSSAGRFWERGMFARFLAEAVDRLTALYGDERARGAFANAPVVIAAYSGGYNPAAYALQVGGADERIRGVLLLDALFGEHERFADWLARRPPAFFVSAYGKAAREDNLAFQRILTERDIAFRSQLAATLARGSVTFIATPDEVRHNDFMTHAWARDPFKLLLRRIPGFSRAGNLTTATTPEP